MVAVVLGLQGGDESEQQLQNISLSHKYVFVRFLGKFFTSPGLLPNLFFVSGSLKKPLSTATNSGCPDPPGRAQCWHNPESIFLSAVIQESHSDASPILES